MPDSTPSIREYQWGGTQADPRLYGWGADVYAYGSVTRVIGRKPLTPEMIIVRAARMMSPPVNAYAVFQPGGVPVLPSIVFESTGVSETDTLERGGLIEQDLSITVRAQSYEEVIDVTDRFYSSLRKVAGSRYRGLTGQFSDSYASRLNYRERTFAITIRR